MDLTVGTRNYLWSVLTIWLPISVTSVSRTPNDRWPSWSGFSHCPDGFTCPLSPQQWPGAHLHGSSEQEDGHGTGSGWAPTPVNSRPPFAAMETYTVCVQVELPVLGCTLGCSWGSPGRRNEQERSRPSTFAVSDGGCVPVPALRAVVP